MDFTTDGKAPGKNITGITVVIVLHVLVAYAVVTGLGKKMIEKIKAPVETKIIEEVKPPPLKDLPPPPPPPKMVAPPPPFIPPPEVQIQQPQSTNAIAAVSNVKPDNPVMPQAAPPAPPAPPPPKPVAAAPVRIPAVVDANACQKPEYPRASLRAEEQGTVTLSFLIGTDGRVVDSKVEQSSGFPALDKAARNGLSLCKFKPGTTDGKPEQSWMKMQYVWKLE